MKFRYMNDKHAWLSNKFKELSNLIQWYEFNANQRQPIVYSAAC